MATKSGECRSSHSKLGKYSDERDFTNSGMDSWRKNEKWIWDKIMDSGY